MRAPDRCHEPVLAPEVRESRVCREIHAEDQKRKRVNEAIAGQMAFPGEDGLLNAMYELGPRFTREDFGHLLDAWVVHMCTDRHQIMDENDNVRLGALIRHASDQTFDASKAESLVAKLESDAPFCEDGHQHTFPRKSGVEIDVLSAMLADRLVRTDEALAVRWMYSSAPVAIDHEYGMNYAAKATWLAERGYAVEAIEVARRNLWDAAPLARRSGLFQIATCLGLQGDQETADQAVGVALKAGAVEVNYHHIESPMPFLAEARYHLSKGDWRRAFASCQRCGAETKAAFGGAMLEAIKAKDLVSVIAKRARCEQLSGQSIGDVVRDEARRIR